MQNYGALPKGRDELSDTFMGLQASSQKVFIVSYLLGLVTFLVTLICFNTTLYTNPNAVCYAVIGMVVLCVNSIANEKRGLASSITSVWARPIGGSCFVALAVGGISGLYCYDVYGYLTFIYRNSRTYQNVVPSEPAASVADAGRMTFAAEAYVDQTKASGYAAPNGVTYCVAPIRDMVKSSHVEFWAVGYDCCGWSGSFRCDAVGEDGASGGIVVFDNPGIFTNSNQDYYKLAQRKAEASYDMISAKKPIYVRWVKNNDLNMMKSFYEGRTTVFVVLSFFAYAAVSWAFTYTGSIQYYKTYFNLDGL